MGLIYPLIYQSNKNHQNDGLTYHVANMTRDSAHTSSYVNKKVSLIKKIKTVTETRTHGKGGSLRKWENEKTRKPNETASKTKQERNKMDYQYQFTKELINNKQKLMKKT